MLRTLCFLLLSATLAYGQSSTPTVTVATLNDLLARAPRANETVEVLRGYNGQDWGGSRLFTQTPASALATNVAHVFAITNIYGAQGQYLSADRTNSVQDIRWWQGGPAIADNTQALTNAANWVVGLGGGYVYTDVGTYSFLSSNTITMPSGARLKGAGPNATVFNFTSAAPSSDYIPTIRWAGTISDSVRLHSATVAGERSLVLSSSVDWAQGDWIQIANTNDFSGGPRYYYHDGEFNFVYSNTGGTNISLVEPLEGAYPTSPVKINKVTPAVGSAEGIRFAFHVKGGGLELAYTDSRSYIRDCEGAGSENSHFNVRQSYGVKVSNLTVDWDSDPSVGLNYGLVVGDSEYVTVENCFLRSARHGFASGGSTIQTRYLRVTGCTLGSTRQNVAGADMHEDVVMSQFDNCTMLSGVTLGGGRNSLLNCTVLNGRGGTAIATPPGRYYDWTVKGNTIRVTSFDDESQSVWAIRMYLVAGDQSGYPQSTNVWPGTFGSTADQAIRITDNRFQFVGARTNANYAIFIDEASTLSANTNLTASVFGPWELSRNLIQASPDQPFSELTAAAVYVSPNTKIRVPSFVVDGNDHEGGMILNPNLGTVIYRNNISRNSLTREGVYIYPLANAYTSPIDAVVSGNRFERPFGRGFSVSDVGGRISVENNTINNHGSHSTASYRFGFAVSESSRTNTSLRLVRNTIASTNASTYGPYIYTASATVRESETVLGGSTGAGSYTVGGPWIAEPSLPNVVGSTNAVTALGQYADGAGPTNTPPGVASIGGVLSFWNGSGWQTYMPSGTTNFPNLRATNTLNAKDITAETISLRDTGFPVSIFAEKGRRPIYSLAETNAFSEFVVYNTSTGSGAGAGLLATAFGAQGRVTALSTNNSSGNALARFAFSAVVGNGFQYDLAYPNSMDAVWTYGGGFEFARFSTNTFSMPGVTTLAPTNVPTHLLSTASDPTSTRRAVGSFAVTSAGLALMNAANAAAQRTSLGLGTLATVNDAPSDGNVYGRSNATWVVASGGGGVTTNLDNLTVTNTVRFGGNFYVTDAVGGTNRFAIISDSVNSYVQFTSFGDLVVSGGAGLYASSTNNWFYNGLKQYWSGTSDLVWLTSLGFKNATPLRAANILDSTTIDWTTSGTNVTPSIKSQSISTNLIDSTFYSLLMMTNSGGSGTTTTNYLDRTLFYSRGQVIVGTTNALQSLVTGIPAHLSKTISAGSITTNFALHVTAGGTMTSTNDNWSNNKFTVKVGGLSIVHTITDDTSGVSLTDAPWDIDCHVTVTATGTNATVYATSVLRFRYDDGGVVTYPWVFTFPGVVSGTLDTTGSVDVDVLYSMDTSGQEINVKCNSVVATIQGDEILTSGGSGSGSATNLTTIARFIAQDGEPPASNYATFSTRNSIGIMLFDTATQEAMRYRFVYPQGYTATNATIVLKWTTSATSGDARWGGRVMALVGDIDSDSFATAVEATTATSATAGTVNTTTLSGVSLAGAVAADQVWVEIYRDVSDPADTISVDIELQSVEVRVE